MIRVELDGWFGTDEDIARIARVSTNSDKGEVAKLVGYLMKQKHGTPFEHNCLRFYIEAPIFVSREHMRHRIGWSYNELSTRYTELSKIPFYQAPIGRPLVEGDGFKPARPLLEVGDSKTEEMVETECEQVFAMAAEAYLRMVKNGVAREVARNVLPLATITKYFATCNLRSLMSFLSLRTHRANAKHVSYPLWEIEQVANSMETLAKEKFPIAMEVFDSNGRVAP